MKKWMICALIWALCLCVPALAVPEDAQYASTRDFLEVLDGYGMGYTHTGVDDNGDEGVRVNITGQSASFTVRLLFDANGLELSLRAWNVIDFDPSDHDAVLRLCNDLNYGYRWVRFFVDPTDESVTVASDLSFTEADAGELSFKALAQLVNIIDDAWPRLAPYAR